MRRPWHRLYTDLYGMEPLIGHYTPIAQLSPQMSVALNKLIDANLQAIDQVLEVVTALSVASYKARVNGRSQPGAHIRHVLDHYISLQQGIDTGIVDYDHRRRDCQAESCPEVAINELTIIRQWLRELPSENLALQVKSEVSLCDSCSITLDTDLERELLYTLNHTVHHMAYVALLLQSNGEEVNATIGVAPATASHRRTRLAS